MAWPREFRSSRATRWFSRSQQLLVGSQRRRQRLRLLRVRAEVADRTDGAERRRSAYATTMENEAPGRLDPVLLRVDHPEARLDVRTRAVQAKPLGHASDVAVDGQRGDSKGRSEDDRCRLATDPMQPGEGVHVGGHLSIELLEEAMGHRAQRLRLLVVEASRLDV